ncbi:GNAT family N-acetyltransferase [Halobacteriales archaeon QS_1_68_20]|nr:MAG: GNAT family N-acetyltransferase [Halobacteriales archaeon QS_1_68_20]
MSVNLDVRVVEPGDDDHVREAWELKERIREEQGVLRQRWGFFSDAYRRARTHLYFADEDLVGFAVVRRDGYLLFLAVSPDYQGQGFGRRLIADLATEHNTVTCHTRTTNREALDFYESVGFERVRRVDNYYEDGGDAYYLRLGETEGLASKIQRLLGG